MDKLDNLKLFDAKRTQDQLFHVYTIGLAQAKPVWNFGYSKLTEAFPTLTNGLWYVLSPENVGKSMLQLNIGFKVLQNNWDAYWLDFTLDDGVERRLEYLLACSGNLPINLIHQAGDATEDQKEKRRGAFDFFNKTYGTRYHLFGSSNNPNSDEFSYSTEWITDVVAAARKQIGPDAKLFVTVDSFHDMDLVEKSSDAHDKLAKKSSQFKRSASEDNVLYMLTAHTTKNSRKRGQTADAIWGTAQLAYDALIMTHLFSDVNLNREKAVVFWYCQDKPNQMMPVHELDIIKNKAGSKKDVIFFNFYPYNCRDTEADDTTQLYYRNCIYAVKGKKE